MQHAHLIPAAIALAAAAAVPAHSAPAVPAQHPVHGERVARAPGPDDRQFMRAAAQAGHFEVVAGEMAVSRARDASVRDYGQRLMNDHMAANRELERIAGGFGVTLPSRPSDPQQQIVQRLRGMAPGAFDQAFMEQVGIESHDRAIALFQKEANAPSADPALQHFARTTLPTLQEHRRIAQNLHASASRQGARPASSGQQSRTAADAQDEIREAVQVVQRMKSDPGIANLLQQAKGVFILPDYGRAALGVGVQGGQGVLVTRTGNGFGNPVFYNMGGVSVGAQAGASAGQVAFLLMSDRAVQQFRSSQKFSLNADAGLTIGSASTRGQVSGGKVNDVVVWSGTKGAYAGASVALTDVMVDRDANHAYYGRPDATPDSIMRGKVDNPHNNVLGMVLAV